MSGMSVSEEDEVSLILESALKTDLMDFLTQNMPDTDSRQRKMTVIESIIYSRGMFLDPDAISRND